MSNCRLLRHQRLRLPECDLVMRCSLPRQDLRDFALIIGSGLEVFLVDKSHEFFVVLFQVFHKMK